MRRGAAIVALALLAAACGSSATHAASPTTSTTAASCASTAAPAGETHEAMTSGGVARTYIRHVVAATRPLPLIIDLHGYSEGAEIHVHFTGLGAYGDTHGFDTITPQGLGTPVRWDTGIRSADVRFIGDLITEAERTMCVDRDRIYVTGLSNGAFMTSTLACALADRVAAVAAVAGLRDPDDCHPARRIPVLAFHGTADRFVLYDGGIGESALALPAPDGSGKTIGQEGRNVVGLPPKSEPDILAAWAKRDGCGATPTTTHVAADVDLISYPCASGIAVELYRISGGGHAWPGSPFSAAVEKVIGHTTMSISADELLWKFFEAHPLHG